MRMDYKLEMNCKKFGAYGCIMITGLVVLELATTLTSNMLIMHFTFNDL